MKKILEFKKPNLDAYRERINTIKKLDDLTEVTVKLTDLTWELGIEVFSIDNATGQTYIRFNNGKEIKN